jgi:spore maturation protein A
MLVAGEQKILRARDISRSPAYRSVINVHIYGGICGDVSKAWIFLTVFAAVFGLCTGRGDQMGEAVLSSGSQAVTLCIALTGAYCLWCGLLEILMRSGTIDWLARVMRPLTRFLFPGEERNPKALQWICVNFAANMLGMGNAATPAGIEAMRELKPDGDRASNAMCMFLIINASSLQLIPTTAISLRSAMGSASPADIILPTIVVTALTTLLGIVLAARLRGKDARHG